MQKTKFRTGDIVKIVYRGEQYCRLIDFFTNNNFDRELAVRFAFAQELPRKPKGEYVVLAAGLHPDGQVVYAIQPGRENDFTEPVYLIGEDGLALTSTVYRVPVTIGVYMDVLATNEEAAENTAVQSVDSALEAAGLGGWTDYIGVDGEVEVVNRDE